MELQVRGLKETRAFVAKVSGEAAGVGRPIVRAASFLCSKLLKQRVRSNDGGYDSFWGKLSPKAGPYMRGRSGQTAKRITPGGIITEKRDLLGRTYEARVGSPDMHVAFHERGGVIPNDFPGYRMSPKGYLRIPTRAAQFGSGADRWGGTSIRSIPGVFLRKFKSGKLWALRARGGRLEYLYLLQRRSPAHGAHRPRRIFATTQKEVEAAMLRDARQRIARLTSGR